MYDLVVCDSATPWPEAFPLRSAKAKQVANCLLQLCLGEGIPREVLKDCGRNFNFKVLRQVYQLLGVKGIKTTPYHPKQMDWWKGSIRISLCPTLAQIGTTCCHTYR